MIALISLNVIGQQGFGTSGWTWQAVLLGASGVHAKQLTSAAMSVKSGCPFPPNGGAMSPHFPVSSRATGSCFVVESALAVDCLNRVARVWRQPNRHRDSLNRNDPQSVQTGSHPSSATTSGAPSHSSAFSRFTSPNDLTVQLRERSKIVSRHSQRRHPSGIAGHDGMKSVLVDAARLRGGRFGGRTGARVCRSQCYPRHPGHTVPSP